MRVVRAAEREYVAASHENPERPGVYKRVLATHDQLLQGRIQMINWARLPVGASFQAHYHEDMEETFVMIDGEARMEVGSDAVELRRGDAIMVEPGEVHRMTNVGGTDVEYLVIGVSLGRGGQTVVVDG